MTYDLGNVVIRVDQVRSNLAATTTDLHKTESAAEDATEAIGKLGATATKAGQDVAYGMKTAAGTVGATGETFSDFFDKLDKSQASMLQRIKGPWETYKADLQAASSLAQGNQISTSEYEAELGRLQQRLAGLERYSMTPELKREADILDRIQGPLRDYEATLKSLDSLLAKEKIDLADYNRELEKAQKSAGRGLGPMQGPVFNPAQAGLSEELKREAALLEQLEAPMKRYQQDLTTLNSLLGKDQISLEKYDQELEKVQKRAQAAGAIAPIQGPAFNADLAGKNGQAIKESDITGGLQSALSTGGALLAGGAVGGAILGLGHSVEHLIDQYHELKDTYIEVTNTALKFTDATHSTNLIIDEQIRLAHELHSNERATIELYDTVRDGTDDLNISHQDQIRLTKTLAEAVQLAGRSMESAGGVVTRLSYAMARGKVEVGDLSRIMRQVPELGDLWTKAFDTDRQGLLAMVREGKIGVEQIVGSLVNEGKTLDDNFAKRQRTNKQKQEEWELNEKIYSQRYNVGMGAGHVVQESVDALKKDRDLADALRASGGPFSGLAEVAHQQNVEEMNASYQELFKNISNLTGPFQKIGDAYRKMTGDTAAVRSEITRLNEPVEKAKSELETLNKAFEIGKIDVDTYNKELNKLQTTINHGIGSQAFKIAEPIRQARLELAMLNNEIENGADVTQAQYRKAFQQHQTTITGFTPEDLKLNNPKLDAKDQLADLNEQQRQGKITSEAYRREYDQLMTTINDGRLPETIKFWEEFHLPQQQFARDEAALTSLLHSGSITLGEYNMKLRELREALDKTGFAKILDEEHDAFVKQEAAMARYLAGHRTMAQDHAAYQTQLAHEKQLDTLGAAFIEPARVYEQALLNASDAAKQLGLSQEAVIVLQRQARDQFDSASEAIAKATVNVAGYQEALDGYQEALDKLTGQRNSGGLSDQQFQGAVSQLDREAKLLEQFEQPAAIYTRALADISAAVKDLGLSQEHATFLQRKAREEFDNSTEALSKQKGPLEQYEAAVKKLTSQLDRDDISEKQFGDGIDKARVAMLQATGEAQEFKGAMEIEWLKMKGEAEQFGASVAQLAISEFGKLNDAIVTAASNGSVSWSQMAESMIQDLGRIALKALEVKAINAAIGAFGDGGSSGGGGGGDSLNAAIGTGTLIAQLAGLAEGGTGIVGGSGTVDSQVIAFRATPGERVTVTPPGSYPYSPASAPSVAAMAGASQAPVVHIHNHYDSSVAQAALDSPGGQKSVLNTLRVNPGAVRNLTSRPRRA